MLTEFERLFSMIRREIERTLRKLHKAPRMGLVSSYDKINHAVKVRFQPEGTESGWIPLTGVAVGNQFGVLYAPNVMDQVEVHFHEGEHMVARVMTRHFSLADKPPQIDPGEYIQLHQSGSLIKHSADGTLLIGGAGTVQTGQMGGGKSGNISSDGQQSQSQVSTPQQPNAKQTITLKPDGTMVIDVPNNDMNVTVDRNKLNVTIGSDANISVGNNANITVSKDAVVSAGQDATVNAGHDINTNASNDINMSTGPSNSIAMNTPSVVVVGSLSVDNSVSSSSFSGSFPTGIG